MQSRAWVLEAAGDPDGAWELVKKLVGKVQMTPSLARLYGRLAGKYGQPDHALAEINRLMERGACDPGESSLRFHGGAVCSTGLGRFDEAFAMAVQTRTHPEQGNAYDPAAPRRGGRNAD